MIDTNSHKLKAQMNADISKYSRKLFCLFLAVSLCLSHSLVWAEPQITNVPLTLQHRQSITISGSGFGTKNPAAPLVWDDAETGNDPTEKFTSVRPYIGEGVPKYYTTELLGREEPQAHSLSKRYIVGRHWNSEGVYDSARGYNVMLLTGDKDKPIRNFFISYYYKLDSNYPDCCKDGVCDIGDELPNHKTECLGRGYNSVYDSGMSIAAYYWGSPKPKCDSGAKYQFYTITGYPTYESNHWGSPSVPFNRGQWVKRIIALDPGTKDKYGFMQATVLNSQTNFADSTFSEDIWAKHVDVASDDWVIHTVSVGGFERYYGDKGNTIDSFRYFDDVYIDRTFARVVLTDNADYIRSTIIEPQIPSAWSSNSITVTVNQGRLPDGNTYLFVFDENNNRNSVGYPVTFGAGQTLQGDVNGDGKVDIKDLILVAKDFGKTSGFNLGCDINKDSKVDIKDLIIVAKNFGRSN